MNRLTLGEIADQSNGFIQTGPFGSQLHSYDYVDEGIPVVMPQDIVNNRIDLSKISYIEPSLANTLKRHYLRNGDIVFPRRGDIGKCAIFEDDSRLMFCGTGCLKISIPEKDIYPKWLFYYLMQDEVIKHIENNAVGSTMLNLNTGILRSVEVLFPNLETQKKIASTLSHYDNLIQTNQQRIALLEEAAQRLYDEWFIKLRFPNYQQVPVVDGVPDGWEKGSIYDFADILSGGTPNTTEPAYWKGDIPFFTPKDSPDSFFAFSCEKNITKIGLKSCNSRLYLEGSIFITARGTVGKICFAGVPMAMNQSCYSVKPKEDVSTYYFYLALQKSVAQIKQTANGGVFDAIIVDTFKSIDMLRPSKPITDFFHKKTEPLFEQMKNLITQNQKLTQARDELLPRLMSGQLNVTKLTLTEVA